MEMHPQNVNVFAEDGLNIRTQYKELYEKLSKLGQYTSNLLRLAVEEDGRLIQLARTGQDTPTLFMEDSSTRDQVRALYATWEEHYVSDSESMREIRKHLMDNGKKTVRNTMGMHVFLELSRLKLLLRRVDLVMERDNMMRYTSSDLSTDTYMTTYTLKTRTKSPMWIGIVNTYEPELLFASKDSKESAKAKASALSSNEQSLAMRNKLQVIWAKPLLSLTQSETRILIFFLTQQMDEVPTKDPRIVEEFRTVFELVWLRVAQLTSEVYSEEVLDEDLMRMPYPGNRQQKAYCFNRSYLAFCSIYMGEILERFFRYDLLRPNSTLQVPRVDILEAAARSWVTRIVEEQAEGSFEDMYTRTSAEEGYNFPGDETWFKYMYPNQTPGRGVFIATFRPHLYKRYFSEAYMSKATVMASSSVTARMFMLNAVDEYIRMNASHIAWKEGVVMCSADVCYQAEKLTADLCPYLVQVFSTYWVYDQGSVHICDSIFEAIGVWFWLIHTNYDNLLHGSNMKPFSRDILPSDLHDKMAAATFEL